MTNATTAVAVELGHAGVNVTDLDRSAGFYERVLGLRVLARDDGGDPGRRWAFLGRDAGPVVTLWQQSGGRFAADRPGLHHLAFRVESMAEVRAVEDVLRSLGADVLHDGVVAHGEGAGSGGVFFLDPDGTRLEVFAPSGAQTAPAPTAGAPTCGFFEDRSEREEIR